MSGERERAAQPGRPGRDPVAARAEARARHAAVTEPGPVMDAAARFLEARPRSVAETRRRLVDVGYPPDLVETVLTRLGELGYLDDLAFARAWVESRDRAHPRGEAALRRELALKGIPADVVAAALATRRDRAAEHGGGAGADRVDEGPAGGPTSTHLATRPGTPRWTTAGGVAPDAFDPDAAAARRLLDRRGPALLREPDARKRRAKAYALLARHGFDPETCRTAVAAWMRAPGADDPG